MLGIRKQRKKANQTHKISSQNLRTCFTINTLLGTERSSLIFLEQQISNAIIHYLIFNWNISMSIFSTCSDEPLP